MSNKKIPTWLLGVIVEHRYNGFKRKIIKIIPDETDSRNDWIIYYVDIDMWWPGHCKLSTLRKWSGYTLSTVNSGNIYNVDNKA